MINILQPQPAQKMFPFEEGWRLIRSVAEDCRETAIDATKWWREKIQEWASEASLDDSYFIKACIYLGIVLLILSGIGLAILAALCAVFALTAYVIFLCAL